MKVKDLQLQYPETILSFVDSNAPIEAVYDEMMKNQKTRSVFILDEGKKLVGHIDIGTLISYYGARFSSGPIDMLTKFSKLLAHKASDIMSSPVYVRPENELKVAIGVMMESSIFEIPIVDEENKVIGDINCFDLLKTLKENQKDED